MHYINKQNYFWETNIWDTMYDWCTLLALQGNIFHQTYKHWLHRMSVYFQLHFFLIQNSLNVTYFIKINGKDMHLSFKTKKYFFNVFQFDAFWMHQEVKKDVNHLLHYTKHNKSIDRHIVLDSLRLNVLIYKCVKLNIAIFT